MLINVQVKIVSQTYLATWTLKLYDPRGKKKDIHWISISFPNKIIHGNLLAAHKFISLASCFHKG